MMKTTGKLVLIVISIFLFNMTSAQVQINGVSDSTAILDVAFSAQLDVDYLGSAPSYELLESPAGMNINGTGEITWTPSSIDAGGRVVARSWNAGGSSTFAFNVYVSDEILCSPNLISYYQLDETNGTTFEDFQDPANTGTSISSLTDTIGKVGNAQKFLPASATSQFISVPDNDQMEFAVGDQFTYSMWVYSYGKNSFADNETDQVLFARHEAALDRLILAGLDYQGGSAYVRFRVRRNSTTETALTLPDPLPKNSWHLLTFVYEGFSIYGEHDIRIYVDGALEGSVTSWFTGGTNIFMNSPMTIGWFPPDLTEKYPFNGKMDEFMVFDKALSDAEVLQIYQDGNNGDAHCQAGNHAPLFTNAFDNEAAEDELYSLAITTNDYDGDVVTLSDSVLPSWLSLNPGTGILQGTPTNDDLGSHEVILKITDGTVKVSKTFNINVTNTNDAPTITSTPSTSVNEDELYTYIVEFEDIDPGDVLTLSAVAPTWLNLNTISNTLSGTPTNSVLGTEPFVDFNVKVKVTDVAGDSAVQSFVVRVNNVNDAPTILGQNALSTGGSTPITLDIETVYAENHIVDVDNTYPDDFSLTVQSGADYTLQAGNIVTPVNGFRGILKVSAVLSDGEASVSDTIEVSVDNNAPVITSSPVTDGMVDELYSYTITAEDADVDDNLEYFADVIPSWLSFNSDTRTLSGTPIETGFSDVLLRVTDGIDQATQQYQIEVILNSLEGRNTTIFLIYPNPATDQIFIQTENIMESAMFEIIDLAGNIVSQAVIEPNSNMEEINISELSSGVYIYRFIQSDNTISGKLTVK